jgi:hypothetical protein
MREFGADEMPIYVADVTGAYRTHTLGELLPESFSNADLHTAEAESSLGHEPGGRQAAGCDLYKCKVPLL